MRKEYVQVAKFMKKFEKDKKLIFKNEGLYTEVKKLKLYKSSNEKKLNASIYPIHEDKKNYSVVQFRTLESFMRLNNHDRIDILKMDIEGAEYEVIEALPKNRVAINQILIEFHHMYKGIPISKTVDAISTLSNLGFELFNISQRTYEFSFRKKGM